MLGSSRSLPGEAAELSLPSDDKRPYKYARSHRVLEYCGLVVAALLTLWTAHAAVDALPPGKAWLPFLHQPDQTEIDRALVHLQRVLAHLLDPARDAVPMHRPHGIERLQHHQIERALQNLRLALPHSPSSHVGRIEEHIADSCGMQT